MPVEDEYFDELEAEEGAEETIDFDKLIRNLSHAPSSSSNPSAQDVEMSAVSCALVSTLEGRNSPLTPSTLFAILLTTTTSVFNRKNSPINSLLKLFLITVPRVPLELLKGECPFLKTYETYMRLYSGGTLSGVSFCFVPGP